MRIVSLHATHRTLPLEDLERLTAVDAHDLVRDLARLEAVHEVAVLSTCNRFEVYLATPDPVDAHAEAFPLLSGRVEGGLPKGIVMKQGAASVEHLLRVACGLESLIVGEDQVQGQVRDAYNAAQDAGSVGPTLTLVFERALFLGKRARSATRINEGRVSIGSAAVDLAREDLGDLAGRRVTVLGTGEMATLVAHALAPTGAHITILHRANGERGATLADAVGGASAPMSTIDEHVRDADLVVAATASPTPILAPSTFAKRQRDVLVIDLGNPRNVDPDVAGLPRVRLLDLDSLRRVSDANLAARHAEVGLVEAMVQEECTKLAARFESRAAEETLRSLHQRADALRDAELDRLLARLDAVDSTTREALEDFARALTRKLLHEPSTYLKDAQRKGDEDAVEAARRVLDLPPSSTKPRRGVVRPRRRE